MSQPLTISLISVEKKFIQGTQISHVLRGLSVSFVQGHTYALMGVSGTGKSTLLHIIAGLDTPSSGHVSYGKDHEITSGPDKESLLLRDYLGLVFQFPALIYELSVQENVMIKGLLAGKKGPELYTRARELLELVGLADKKDQAPSTLSGGEQQRVAIAQALFNKPAFLIADEPTAQVDEKTRDQIMDLLMHLQKEWCMGLIIASHDVTVVQRMETVFEVHDGFLYRKK